MKFKTGDQVLRVDGPSSGGVVRGGVYTVLESMNEDRLRLKGISGFWRPGNFSMWEPKGINGMYTVVGIPCEILEGIPDAAGSAVFMEGISVYRQIYVSRDAAKAGARKLAQTYSEEDVYFVVMKADWSVRTRVTVEEAEL